MTGGRPGHEPVSMAVILPIPHDLEAMRSSGIAAVSLQLGTDPRARVDAPWLLDGVKSTSYAVNMAARDEALRRGADDEDRRPEPKHDLARLVGCVAEADAHVSGTTTTD